MLKIISLSAILIGALIMLVSIVKHYKSVVHANAIYKKNKDFKISSYNLSLILMCLFLIAYLVNGGIIALETKPRMQDMILSIIYMFGAIFLYIMVVSQGRVVNLRTREVLNTITDSIENMIYVIDPDNYEILFSNRSHAKSYNKKPSDLIGKTCFKVLKESHEDFCQNCPIEILFDENGKAISKDIASSSEIYYPNSKVTYYTSSSLITWVDNRQVILCNAIDISERKAYEYNLQTCAMYDKLTNAYNRAWAHQLLDQIFLKDSATRLPITFCFMDIDGLKYINDNYGHEAGDEILQRFVSSIQANIREVDLLIRWGGDEFLLILDSSLSEAKDIIARIESYIDLENKKTDKSKALSFSYGLEEVSEINDICWETYVNQADSKMYQQKLTKKSK